ncbi:MAG: penicillin-binding protein 2 [Candidatus Marinimicrobia bacterium]|nr:penicillin-binding protein 2 [Candidatus Neomarinimicrobiota bacterium]
MLKTENLVSRQRLVILSSLVSVLLFALIGRFFQLQIYNYEKYKVKSEANIIRAQSIPAPRGLIYDREGNILVDNYPTYLLTAIPIEMGNVDTVLHKISGYIDVDTTTLIKNYKKYYQGRFHPTRLAKDLSIEQLSRIAEHKLELPGVNYKQMPERYYPGLINASHIIGYIREVDRRFLETGNESGQYRLGDMIGWRGLEKTYESRLRGIDGVRYLQVDALGREVGAVAGHQIIKPIPGEDLFLSLDRDLQILIEREMIERAGAVIVSRPQTGEILAIASFPDYPPDLFTGITLDEEWNFYAQSATKPLVNRITNGLYPPGSTFKPLVLLGLLSHNLIDTNKTIICKGKYRLGRGVFECWKPGGHNKVNLRKAIEQSCNVYFYNMIQLMDLDDWAAVCHSFNFGEKSGIDLPSELTGTIPTTEFMDNKYGKRRWSKGNLLNIVIGQGDILVTPIQMLLYINQIATRGNAVTPHLILKGNESIDNKPDISDEIWDILHDFMHGVTNSAHGTGRLAQPKLPGVITYGKTGTAENPHGEAHAWYIGWGEKDNQMLSVVILVENAGHGGDVAAPIARKIFELYFPKYHPLITVET